MRLLTMGLIWCLILLVNVKALATLSRKKKPNQPQWENGKVVLEDTYNYKSDMNWTVYREAADYDDDYVYYEDQFVRGWEDLSGSTRHRAYSVCDVTESQNWLRSKYINIHDFREVEITIEIEYSFPDCTATDYECGNIFNVYRFDSSTDKASDQFPEWSESKSPSGGYQKLKTIAAQERFDQADPNKTSHVSRETITFKPNQSGFYIAFKTSKTCMSLQRVRIFYYNCVGFDNGLTKFASSPSDSTRAKKVKGTCVNFAVPIGGDEPQAYCNQQGDWLESSDQCQCQAGYERENDKCIKCGVNYYKQDASTDQCSPCPNNRHTNGQSAAKQCNCRVGYRSNGNTRQQCYKPATRPQIKLGQVTTDSIEYSIEQPSDDSERVGLSYEVTVCTEQRGSDSAYDCLDRGPAQINAANNLVTGLQIDTDYIIRIKAANIVSKSSDTKNTSEQRFRTKLPKPTIIYGFTSSVSYDQGYFDLEWEELINVDYYLLEMKLPSGSSKVYNLTATRFKHENIEPGPYMINLRAVNKAGEGSILSETVQVQLDDTLPIHMYGVAAAIGLLFVILLVVSLYCCCCRQTKPKEKKKYLDENTGLVEDKVLEVAELQSPTSSPAVANNYEIGPDDLMPNFDYMEINPIDIQMEKAIMGEGEFAEVRKAYLVNKLGEREPVAAKKLKTGVGMRAQLDFIEEGQILQGFDHPSIISLKGVVTKYRPLMILTEFMDNGSLDEYLRLNRGKITVLDMIQMLRQVASGMEYLQSKGFIHRDLAARNILVDASKSTRIADFGLSRLMDTPGADQVAPIYVAHGGKVAIKWTSPEAIKHKIFTPASDVWSFGVLCWEVMTYGDRPFWDMPNDEVIKSISMGLRLPCPQGCPQVVHELMLKCWAEEPSRRPNFEAIKSELDSFLNDPSQLNGNDGVFSESSTVSYNSHDNRMSSFYTTLQ